ncbi:response regulator transcription factor [soil metagenome]
MIRVLIADDNAAFRFGLTTLLGALPELTVVAEAATGEEAVVRALRERPDVVLMDLDMADADDGITATQRLTQSAPDIGVLVLTMADSEDQLGAALRAGARGFLVKGASRTEVDRAVRTVAAGGLVLGPGLARRLGVLVAPDRQGGADTLAALTGREREVLDLVARGMDNAAIARRLVLSPKTVRNTVSAVLTKLPVDDRVQAALLARECGLGADDGAGGGQGGVPGPSRPGRDAYP